MNILPAQTAFVLHTRPYREHQVIAQLLTEFDGKVSAITYVSKSGKSNKKGLLQPFLPLSVSLKGKGELKSLSQVESAQTSYPLKGNYLYSGLYLNELLVRLLGENIPCELLFSLYKESLSALAEQQPIELVLRSFEQQLLEELGLCFDFSPVYQSPHDYFYYLAEHGFVPAEKPYQGHYYSRQNLQAIAEQQLDCSDVLKSYKILMRQVLGQLLGPKPLNSRKLFSRNS